MEIIFRKCLLYSSWESNLARIFLNAAFNSFWRFACIIIGLIGLSAGGGAELGDLGAGDNPPPEAPIPGSGGNPPPPPGGGGTETLNDTNLIAGECTLRIHLNNGASVATQNSYFYTFDGSTTTTEAVEVEAYAFEQGVSATTWTQVNDDSGNVGGNNSGERLDLGEKSAATDHYWYLAISARGESAGAKTSFDLGFATEIY